MGLVIPAGHRAVEDNLTAFRFIKEMRARLGVSMNDTSRDADIAKMSPMERLRLLAGWNLGDPGWAATFIAWAKDCGFKIE